MGVGSPCEISQPLFLHTDEFSVAYGSAGLRIETNPRTKGFTYEEAISSLNKEELLLACDHVDAQRRDDPDWGLDIVDQSKFAEWQKNN